eukprot:scaffold37993_cov59-Attheya_sp.AAC.5
MFKSHRGGSRDVVAPLDELREAITRIEQLCELARNGGSSIRSSSTTNPTTARSSSRPRASSRMRDRASASKAKATETLRRTKRQKEVPAAAAAPKSGTTSAPVQGSHTNTNTNTNTHTKDEGALFVSLEDEEEEEFVELLRRTAELVVRAERSAAHTLEAQEKRYPRKTTAKMRQAEEKEEAELASHLAVYEHFCERNAFSLIVNIVTGIAFQPKTTTTTASKQVNSSTMLPPLIIATQAVQSVSILIQNVSRVTSMYYLLSNNRINDLIDFPLGLYSLAEQQLTIKRRLQSEGTTAATNTTTATTPTLRKKTMVPDFSTPEMAELSTHFVSFLKSLAMRMNAETLQFFLSYPNEHNGSSGTDEDGSSNKNADDVEFPLYARALEFCGSGHDHFVRVTAMNVCLNTLRLATVYDAPLPENMMESGDQETNANDNDSLASSNGEGGSMKVNTSDKLLQQDKNKKTPNVSTPSMSLHNAESLPLRERLAIARHVCTPSRVEGLVVPICTKLGQLCHKLEDSVRSLDSLHEKKATRIQVVQIQGRDRIVDNFKLLVGDLQDEILLLEDVLKVGLISLNEQIIERLLAVVIYPILLQPLLLYSKGFHAQSRRAANESSSSVNTNTDSSSLNSAGVPAIFSNPFSVESLLNSLERSGLMGDDDD